jgi:hypothetical protein
MLENYRDSIDKDPKEVLDIYLSDSKCASQYAYILRHTDTNKSIQDFDNLLSTLYFQILEWLGHVKKTLKNDSYLEAKKICSEGIDDVLIKVKTLNIFNYNQSTVNIDYIVMAYTQSILSNLCQKYGRYKLGMNMYSEWLMLDTFIKTTYGFSYDEIFEQGWRRSDRGDNAEQKKLEIRGHAIGYDVLAEDKEGMLTSTDIAKIIKNCLEFLQDKTVPDIKQIRENWLTDSRFEDRKKPGRPKGKAENRRKTIERITKDIINNYQHSVG